MPVIDEWIFSRRGGTQSARIREDALRFTYEVNYGPGWSPRTNADFQEVARRLKWALTTHADQIRAEEVARIRQELLVAVRHLWGAESMTADNIKTILDRICPEVPVAHAKASPPADRD